MLITIVYGLMLTDLFASLHRLIRNRRLVRWHWLPLLAAWYVLLILLKNWWDLPFSQDSQRWQHLLVFLAYGHMLVLWYLVVSTVLPDEVPAAGLDLKEFYFRNHRVLWLLMALVLALSQAITLGSSLAEGEVIRVSSLLSAAVYLLFVLSLAAWKNYRLHAVLLPVFVLEILLEILHRTV